MLGAVALALAFGTWLANGWVGSAVPLLGLPLLWGLRTRPGLSQFCLFLLLLAPAAWWASLRSPVPGPQDVSRFAARQFTRLEGVVASPPVSGHNGWRGVVQVRTITWPPHASATGSLVVTWPSRARPLVGERWRFAGAVTRPAGAQNPGDFDYAAYLKRRGIFACLHAEGASRLSRDERWRWQTLLDTTRLRLLEGLGAGLAPKEAALFGSLIFGAGAAPVDEATADAFRCIGLSHLLAASGAQVGLMLVLLFAGARRIGVSSGWAALWTAPWLLVYLAITGFPPSMVRATLMGLLALTGRAMQRRGVPYAALYASAIAMLLWDPGCLYDIGWQFSYMATYGLMRLGGWLQTRPIPLPEWLLGTLLVPVAASAWVTPWQAATFHTWSWLSLPANWFAEPLVMALTPWGMGLAALGLVAPWASAWLNRLTYVPLWLLEAGVSHLAALPAASLTAPAIGGLTLIGIYAALWCGLRRRRMAIAGLLLAVLGLPASAQPKLLQLSFLSVGQGDALVIRTPHGHWLVVDGGPSDKDFNAGAATVVPYLQREGCQAIDLMVATHAHRDHIGGLPAIEAVFPVHEAWDAGQPEESSVNDALLASWLVHGVPWAIAYPGLTRTIDGVRLDVLSAGRNLDDLNNGSVVVKLSYGRFRALLTGDMQLEAEKHLLTTSTDLRADVLKVAHHGSRTGTTPEWLARVRPKLGIISVGVHNRFGHPHAVTLRHLRRAQVQVVRTDQVGAVLVRSNGVHSWFTDDASDWRKWQRL